MYRVYKIGDFLLGSSGNTGAGQQNSPVMSRLTNISKLAYFACLSRRRLRIMQNPAFNSLMWRSSWTFSNDRF